MARKVSPVRTNGNSKAAVATPVRNSAIPKTQSMPAKVVTYEMIARRAYEISQSPQGRSEFDNWVRAERELNGK
jgi:hypothetical protein